MKTELVILAVLFAVAFFSGRCLAKHHSKRHDDERR